jgi:hypothetical protein
MSRDDPTVTFADFGGGLNTTDDPVHLRDNELPDMLNWDPWRKALVKRRGILKFNPLALPSNPYFLESFIQKSGAKKLITQATETAKHTPAVTQTGALFYQSPGDGAVSAIPWYTTGTVNVTNGLAAVTGILTEWVANLRVPTQFWFRVLQTGVGADPSWYTILAVPGATSLTLNRTFEGLTQLGVAYQIAKPMAADIEAYSPGTFKDNFWLSQVPSDPQRYDGTVMHEWGNLEPAAAPATLAIAGATVTAGNHGIVAVYDYGTFGKSIPSPSVTINAAAPNRRYTITPARGPQACLNIEIYGTLTSGAGPVPAGATYYFIGLVSNTAGVLNVDFNVSDATLGAVTQTLEMDFGVPDQGNTKPGKIKYAKFLAGRCFAATVDNPNNLIISKPDLPGIFPQGNTIPIEPEDGEIISGLAESYGFLVVMKELSKQYYLSEPGPNATVTRINDSKGCVSHKSIAYRDGLFIYHTRDGVAAGTYRGSKLISEKILSALQTVKQAITRFGRHTKSTKSELETGASLVDLEVSADNEIVHSEFPFIDTANADWIDPLTAVSGVGVGGGLTRGVGGGNGPVATHRVPDKLYLDMVATATPSQIRNIAHNNMGGVPSAWSSTVAQPVTNAFDGNPATYWSSLNTATPGDYVLSYTFLGSRWKMNRVKAQYQVRFFSGSGGATINATVEAFTYSTLSGGPPGTWTVLNTVTSVPIATSDGARIQTIDVSFPTVIADAIRIKFSIISNSGLLLVFRTWYLEAFEPGFLPSGTFTSEVFDTGATSGPPGILETLLTSGEQNNTDPTGGTAVTAVLPKVEMFMATGDVAVPDSTWSGFVFQSVGSPMQAVVPLTGKHGRYVQYQLVLTQGAGGTPEQNASVTPTIDEAGINFIVPGTYESGVIDIGAAPTAWGLFTFDEILNGGTVVGKIRTGPVAVPDGSWTSYTTYVSGMAITNTLNRYVQVRFELFPGAVPSVSEGSKVIQFEIKWSTSVTPASKFPSIGKIWDGKYYLAVERMQSSFNDRVYVCDLANVAEDGIPPWTVYDWKMNGLTVQGNTFYGAGSSLPRLYYLLRNWDDDGTEVRSFFKTKPFLFEGRMKKFRRVWVLGNANKAADVSPPVDLFNRIKLFFNTNANSQDLPMDFLGPGQRLSTLAMVASGNTGEASESSITAVSGAKALEHNLGQGRADHRMSGRGNYLQIRCEHNDKNIVRLSVTGFQVQFEVRKPVGAP